MPPRNPAGEPAFPWWVTLLDALMIVVACVMVSHLAFGGFRIRFGDLRLTAESPLRLVVILTLLAVGRHWFRPRPALPQRVVAWARSVWGSPARPVVLPAFVLSRVMVLAVGFLGVVLVGFPQPDPPDPHLAQRARQPAGALGCRLVPRHRARGVQ